MLGLVRAVLLLIGAVLVVVLINKSSVKRKMLVIAIGLVLLFCLNMLLSLFPIENLFVYFPTPQNAFEYAYSGQVTKCIEGKESTLVIYKEDDGDSGICILPKSDKGWQIDTVSYYNRVYGKKVREYELEIYHAENTEDYYVLVDIWFADKTLGVSDSRNSSFLCVEETLPLQTKSYEHFAYVENIENGYEIQIGDETVSVELNKSDSALRKFWNFILP